MSVHGGTGKRGKGRLNPPDNIGGDGGGPVTPANALRDENDNFILDEDGNYIEGE
jgi:hypothetical protein